MQNLIVKLAEATIALALLTVQAAEMRMEEMGLKPPINTSSSPVGVLYQIEEKEAPEGRILRLNEGQITSSTIKELIIATAQDYGVDVKLALDLAWAESQFKPNAKNGSSTAKGIFQFINKTWNDYCEGSVFEAEANIMCAIKLLDKGGLRHWSVDKTICGMLVKKGHLESKEKC